MIALKDFTNKIHKYKRYDEGKYLSNSNCEKILLAK